MSETKGFRIDVTTKTKAGFYHVYVYKENKLVFSWYATRKSETAKNKVLDRIGFLLLNPSYWPKKHKLSRIVKKLKS